MNSAVKTEPKDKVVFFWGGTEDRFKNLWYDVCEVLLGMLLLIIKILKNYLKLWSLTLSRLGSEF